MIGLSAADEVAVERFLVGAIGFGDIHGYLRRGAELGARSGGDTGSVDGILDIDAAVRRALAPATVGV